MTPTDFFDWLRDQGALDAFIENAGFAVVTQLTASKNQENTEDFLDNSFYWAESPQGMYYWRDLDKEWAKVCSPAENSQ